MDVRGLARCYLGNPDRVIEASDDVAHPGDLIVRPDVRIPVARIPEGQIPASQDGGATKRLMLKYGSFARLENSDKAVGLSASR